MANAGEHLDPPAPGLQTGRENRVSESIEPDVSGLSGPELPAAHGDFGGPDDPPHAAGGYKAKSSADGCQDGSKGEGHGFIHEGSMADYGICSVCGQCGGTAGSRPPHQPDHGMERRRDAPFARSGNNFHDE